MWLACLELTELWLSPTTAGELIRTAAQVRAARIPLTSFLEHWQIDLTIDGADEVERETLATPIVAGSTIFGTKDYKAAIAAIRANAGAGAAKQAMSRAPAACRAVGSFSPPSTSITGSRPRCAHNRPLRVPEDRFEQIPMTGD